MRGKAEIIGAEPPHVQREIGCRLHRVRKKRGAVRVRDFRRLLHGLDCTQLVACVHHGDERRGIVYVFFQIGKADSATRIHGNHIRFEAFFRRQFFGGNHDGVMFGGGNENFISAAFFLRARRAEHGEIIRFGAARSEIYFVIFRADQPRDDAARFIQRAHRLSAEIVLRVGVAVRLREIRQHFLQHLLIQRGGCRVIEINSFLSFHKRFPSVFSPERRTKPILLIIQISGRIVKSNGAAAKKILPRNTARRPLFGFFQRFLHVFYHFFRRKIRFRQSKFFFDKIRHAKRRGMSFCGRKFVLYYLCDREKRQKTGFCLCRSTKTYKENYL